MLATPRPAPTTGISEVDAVIRATLAGDVDSILALVQYERVGCVVPEQEGGPPGCTTAEAPGTLIDAFPVIACGGVDQRPEGVRRSIDAAVHVMPVEVYSVFKPIGSNADYHVVFDYIGAADWNGFTFPVKGGRITGLYNTCSSVVDSTKGVREFVVPPPPGPHVSGTLTIAGERLTDFVPTPYYGFRVTGSFDHSIEEAHQPDSFAWSVPATLVYDGVARWWRVYWHRGQVFDCSQSCGVALAEADADARIKALKAGDPVCVVGWTDDVGNVTGEAVYLHPPKYCRVPE